MLEQEVARQDAALAVDKEPEQIEFLRGERNFLLADVDLARRAVELDAAGFDRGRLFAFAGAAQDGGHARDELLGVEGLGDIIVGADAQTGDLVGHFLLRGQDDDGQGRELLVIPDLGEQIDAVAVGKVAIEEQELRRLLFEARARLRQGVDGLGFVALAFEHLENEVGRGGLVLDDENLRLDHRAKFSTFTMGCCRGFRAFRVPAYPLGNAARARSCSASGRAR